MQQCVGEVTSESSGKMSLPLLVLVLLPLCGGQNWNAPDFCHNSPCPEFTVVEKHQDFEERLYAHTEWITNNIASAEATGLITANSRVKKVSGNIHSWPVLITNAGNLSLSWFLPPGTTMTDITDPSVYRRSRPGVTVYVRVFEGAPSIKSGQETAKELCKALNNAGKTCTDPQTYTGAFYESYFSLTHHNEIWMDKTR